MPSSASSRSKSGTPSLRKRAARRNVTGASIVRPARHADSAAGGGVPLTLTRTCPAAARHAPPSFTATTATLRLT